MRHAITILIGSTTGNAERVATTVAASLAARARIEMLDMEHLTPSVFERDAVFLICTSTYGQGDVPDNAWEFYQALVDERPDLRRIRYGVIALGDRTHGDSFALGGKRFDQILTGLGATRIGYVYCHDASSGVEPEDEALAWAQPWLDLLENTEPLQ